MRGQLLFIASAIQGNGAKYVATSLAIDLKKQFPSKKVLLIDFDFEYPYLAQQFVEEESTRSLDKLASYVIEKSIETSAFEQEIVKTRIDVDLIKGTMFPGRSRNFTTNQVEAILEKGKELYDYVIAVGSVKTNNAGTVVSLIRADQVVCVVRDNLSNLQHAKWAIRGMMHYTTAPEILVVYNQLDSQSRRNVLEGINGRQLRVIGAIQYDAKSIDNENSERKDSFFNKSVNGREFSKINQEVWN